MAESPQASFYISCALGFEEELAREIRECWPWLLETDGRLHHSPLPELKEERGGVALQAPFHLGLQLNFFLKTPHRILWRVAEFQVRDFPKLFEKIRSLPWEQYLSSKNVEWVAAASKSRLNHEGRIVDTCREAFAKSWRGPAGENSHEPQQIYVRIHEDRCMVSLDSSGEHLHKRGWAASKGEAPLRESIAAFLMRQMIHEATPGELQNITLVDPLCGSGTLLLEGASLWRPQFERDFAFLSWKITPKIFRSRLWKKNYKLIQQRGPFKKYRGFDIEAKVLKAAGENTRRLEEQMNLSDLDIAWTQEDLFQKSFSEQGPIWCISNPPYGERLRLSGEGATSFQTLLQRMAEKFRPQRLGLLLPDKGETQRLRAPLGYERVQDLHFSNGGLEVVFLVYSADAY